MPASRFCQNSRTLSRAGKTARHADNGHAVQRIDLVPAVTYFRLRSTSFCRLHARHGFLLAACAVVYGLRGQTRVAISGQLPGQRSHRWILQQGNDRQAASKGLLQFPVRLHQQ